MPGDTLSRVIRKETYDQMVVEPTLPSRTAPVKIPGPATKKVARKAPNLVESFAALASKAPVTQTVEEKRPQSWLTTLREGATKGITYPIKWTLQGVSKVLQGMNDVDAAWAQYLTLQYKSTVTGLPVEQLMAKKPGESTWDALKREHNEIPDWKTRMAEEVILSPFNLLLFVNPFTKVSQVAARATSDIYVKSVLGEGNSFYKFATKLISPTKQAQRVRVGEVTKDWLSLFSGTREPTTGMLIDTPQRFLDVAKGFLTEDPDTMSLVNGAWRTKKLGILGTAKEALQVKAGISQPAKLSTTLMSDAKEFRAYMGKAIAGTNKPGTKEFIDAVNQWHIDNLITKKPIPELIQEISTSIADKAVPKTGGYNQLFRFSQQVKNNLAPMWLFARPAYTAYNQSMNVMMVMLTNPTTAYKYIPKYTKIFAKPEFMNEIEKELGPITAKYISEGFGGMTAESMTRRTLQSLPKELASKVEAGEKLTFGETFKAFRASGTPEGNRTLLEKIPGVGFISDLTRATNLRGESLAKAIDYVAVQDKVFKHEYGRLLRSMGVAEDKVGMLVNLNKEGLDTLAKGKGITPALFDRHSVLQPGELSLVQEELAKLPANHTVTDRLAAIDNAKSRMMSEGWEGLRQRIVVEFGQPEDSLELLSKDLRAKVEDRLKSLPPGGSEVDRLKAYETALLSELKTTNPSHVAFWERVNKAGAEVATSGETAKNEMLAWVAAGREKTEAYNIAQKEIADITARTVHQTHINWVAGMPRIQQLYEEGKVVEAQKLMKQIGGRNTILWNNQRKAENEINNNIFLKYKAYFDKPSLSQEEKDNLAKGLAMLDYGKRIPDADVTKILTDLGMPEADPNRKGLLSWIEAERNKSVDRFNEARKATAEAYSKHILGDSVTNLGISIQGATSLRNEAFTLSHREALRRSQNDLFNYAHRTNLDYGLQHLMPFPYWNTRFVMHWAQRAVENPNQLNIIASLMKNWNEENKNKPPYLRFSAFKFKAPGGTELMLSPMTFFFPLGYNLMDILKYGEDTDDVVDAISNVQDAIGGYLYPMWEIALGTIGVGYKTRGTGLVKDPLEAMKNFIPQEKIIGSGIGSISPSILKWMAGKVANNQPLIPEETMNQTIFAIGDAANAGKIDKLQAENAIKSLQSGELDGVALKYLGQVSKRTFGQSLMRYAGLPFSVVAPDSMQTFQARKQYYGDTPEVEPVHPDIQKAIDAQYPGLEVVRGKVTPSGLTKGQYEQWKAASNFFETSRSVGDERDALLKQLQIDFEKPGSKLTGNNYMDERKNIYTSYNSKINLAKEIAMNKDAPITNTERELFWKSVGRKTWPTHPAEQLLNDFYKIEAEQFKEGSLIDWNAFFNAREDFLSSLDPISRKWIEQEVDSPDRPDADYRKALKVLKPYFSVKDNLLMQVDETTRDAMELVDIYNTKYRQGLIDVNTLRTIESSPVVRKFNQSVDMSKEILRRSNPEIQRYLIRYFGGRDLE